MANYRKIWENANGPIPKDELGRSYEIHHIDGNRKNNDLSNLMCVSLQEHYEIHLRQGDYLAAHFIATKIEEYSEFIGWKHSDATKEKQRLAMLGKKRGKYNMSDKPRKPHKPHKKRSDASSVGEFKNRRPGPLTEDHKEKIRLAKKGRPQAKSACDKCGAIGSATNMTRYHHKKCDGTLMRVLGSNLL